ncbi:uncharacterized protein THITE_2120879 [Thermothielavioides terrestris NRRL 8126]|uniref:Complex III subunit 9 n=1 Tax=Thermothielavioides terrestris (strain ATCC 38088 / NRRL 8126) TaxID=578455 RepID=G2RE10_THETT|nr:uncharacterized protein THITE_2120879 [Thermothielavioides terrestris NRRL 8126]AEO70037.1 hypothetical protein THITE_2120879 [Thermothielavioides terrestris NRRL 8126]
MASALYNALFRRNYTMLGVVFAAAFVFEVGFNDVMNKIWDNHNRGRQWKDIRHNLARSAFESVLFQCSWASLLLPQSRTSLTSIQCLPTR